MENSLTILIPTRPQPDTLVAIFLLKTFGEKQFPGISNASVKVQAVVPSKSFEEFLSEGILLLDVGQSPFDHHVHGLCASVLVAKYFGVENDPTLSRLLAYALRDDREGKGILSTDPIDRAFGLSGLIAALNKQYPNDAQKVVDRIMPLLAAHYFGAVEHHVDLPNDVAEKKKHGHYGETTLMQGKKRVKSIWIVSDKPSMPTYLRSWNGGRADVVVQKSEEGNKVCILTRQERKINLSMAAALIRLREAEIRSIEIQDNPLYLSQEGRISELPLWYLDPATNSFLNVGDSLEDHSAIPWDEMKIIVKKGLELAPEK